MLTLQELKQIVDVPDFGVKLPTAKQLRTSRSAVFLAVLFRPLCMENGECDYLSLWWFMGIPFGIHRMFFWVIPKG